MPQLSVQTPVTTVETIRLLVIGNRGHWPDGLSELARRGHIELTAVSSYREGRDPALLGASDGVILAGPVPEGFPERIDGDLQLLSDALTAHRLKCVVLTPGISGGVPCTDDTYVPVPDGISADELWGRVAMMKQFAPLLSRFEDQVALMQRLGKKLNKQFVEVDQELRLATRLQQDFLPKELPAVGDVQFAALLRPANWVSGDVYDIRRLDEQHIGFYIADAVGHGVAAGLLTMFIRQSIVGKRVREDRYEIVSPAEVLARLNADLARQNLPNCQFVTGCYGVVNATTGELRFARGGHPHPIHVSAAGNCGEVHCDGGLLGVFEEEEFETTRLILEPGEKFILYSDGLEETIIDRRDRRSDHVQFTEPFREIVRLPADACLDALRMLLDRAEGSLAPEDDITFLVVSRRQ